MTTVAVRHEMGDHLAQCGAVNTVLGLTCNREPHGPEHAHYQADSNSTRAWYEPFCVQCTPAPATFHCRELGHTIPEPGRD